jgi:hypothetical protein
MGEFRLIKQTSTESSVIESTIIHGYFVREISLVKVTPTDEDMGLRHSTKLLSP